MDSRCIWRESRRRLRSRSDSSYRCSKLLIEYRLVPKATPIVRRRIPRKIIGHLRFCNGATFFEKYFSRLNNGNILSELVAATH